MASAFQTPKRPFPGQFATPASVAAPREDQYRRDSLYPSLDGLPRELGATSRSYSYGGQQAPEPVPYRPQNALVQRQPSSSAVATQDRAPPSQEPLGPKQRGARSIAQALENESRYPALDDIIGQGSSGEYELAQNYAPEPFIRSAQHTIPDAIFEQYNRATSHTLMGLFPDLKQAWITVDNRLYLWDYSSGSGFQGYEAQPNNITAVKLLKPKAGVFVSQVSYVLVIATSVDVFLLGVEVQDNARGSMDVVLYETKMSVPTKAQDVTIIEGSRTTGRIFFASKADNDVYEFTYQAEERWFHGRCGKVCHTNGGMSTVIPRISWFNDQKDSETVEQIVIDDTRNLLYTLSSASTIRVFQMKPDGALNLCITHAFSNTLANVRVMSSSSNIGPESPIIAISPVVAQQARRTHLVAITKSGCRLFMNAVSSGYDYGTDSPPSSMQVVHIRHPPSGAPIHNNVRRAKVFTPGYFFCFLEQDAYNDTLLLCAPDPAKITVLNEAGPQQLRLIEQGQLIPLESRVEAIELVGGAFAATSTPQGFGNETATQFDLVPSEIAVLTNSGVHVIQRRRLVDIFDATLRFGTPGSGVDAEVKKFFETYGRAEGCAAALAVACGAGTNDSASQPSRISDPEVCDLARKYFIEFGGKPFAEGGYYDTGSLPHIDQIHPSGRAEGLIYYTARIVRSIWKSYIITPSAVPGGGVTYSSSVDSGKLKSIQAQLISLSSFLSEHKNYISGLSGPQNLFTTGGNKVDEVANQSEHRTLHSMVTLIESMIEGISFVLCLLEDKVDDIIISLPEQQQRAVRELTYSALFASSQGQDLAKELVTAIVNRHIATGSNVDAVADALRRRCGSFCSADDVVMFKAIEFVRRAKDEGDHEARNRLLRESLRLFEETAASLTMENLTDTVAEYRGLDFYQGAVQLALTVAKQIDRGDTAIAFLDEPPSEDNHSSAADLYRRRLECYQLIFHVLEDLEQTSKSTPDMVNGIISGPARIRNETWLTLFTSTDIVFHYSLYDWLFSRDQADRLLEVDSPHVLNYLKHRGQESIQHCDFMWKYLHRQNNLLEAAEVLQELALSEFELPLAERLKYLSRASLFCQSPGHFGARQQMNQVGQQIQEQIDVASIQQDILERVRGDDRISAEKKAKLVAELDFKLIDLTTLYNRFADPYGYMDICLSIFQSADHRGLTEIRTCWEQLISQIHQNATASGSSSNTITDHPYELIANEIRRLGKRFTNSEYIFPPSELILLLEKYDQEFQRDVAPQGWVVKTMVDAGVKEEAVLAVLEEMFHRDEPPFRGTARKRLLADAVVCVDGWWTKILRGQRGREGFREMEVMNVLRSMARLVLQGRGEEWEAVERLCQSIERNGMERRGF